VKTFLNLRLQRKVIKCSDEIFIKDSIENLIELFKYVRNKFVAVNPHFYVEFIKYRRHRL